jgi:CrcB protein
VTRLALVCLGGALGSGARYLVATGIGRLGGVTSSTSLTLFPWGTLAVNVAGCFAIEVVVQASRLAGLPPLALLTLTTGVMGGFTTYSAFNDQLLDLARQGRWTLAAAYLAATTLGCLAAGLLGIAAGQALWGR